MIDGVNKICYIYLKIYSVSFSIYFHNPFMNWSSKNLLGLGERNFSIDFFPLKTCSILPRIHLLKGKKQSMHSFWIRFHLLVKGILFIKLSRKCPFHLYFVGACILHVHFISKELIFIFSKNLNNGLANIHTPRHFIWLCDIKCCFKIVFFWKCSFCILHIIITQLYLNKN